MPSIERDGWSSLADGEIRHCQHSTDAGWVIPLSHRPQSYQHYILQKELDSFIIDLQ